MTSDDKSPEARGHVAPEDTTPGELVSPPTGDTKPTPIAQPKTSVERKRSFTSAVITVSVFSAAGVLGGLFKIPSPVGSIALDSMPGFFAAAFYGPLIGALVGAIGHVGSAATAGFPLGGMLHANVALHMFVWCGVYGLIARQWNRTWALYVAAVVAILLNGLVSPMLLVPAGLPVDTAKAIVPFLLAAAALNVVVATLATKILARMDVGEL